MQTTGTTTKKRDEVKKNSEKQKQGEKKTTFLLSFMSVSPSGRPQWNTYKKTKKKNTRYWCVAANSNERVRVCVCVHFFSRLFTENRKKRKKSCLCPFHGNTHLSHRVAHEINKELVRTPHIQAYALSSSIKKIKEKGEKLVG